MRRRLIDLYKQLFVRRALVGFHRRLVTVGLWGLGLLNSENQAWSGEAHFLRGLPQFFDPGREFVALDIGAHVGAYARALKDLYPRAVVYAFEPHPGHFEALERQARESGFEAYRLALGDTAGDAQLYDRAGPGSAHASLFRDVIEHVHREPAVQHAVTVTTVDQFAEARGLAHVHLMKIDAEGGELNVLRGAERLLSAGAVDVIQFEFNEMNVVSRVFLRDFRALLAGYSLYRMLPDGLAPIAPHPVFLSELFAFQNIVAVKE
jgi:FkbM family methyltransferase